MARVTPRLARLGMDTAVKFYNQAPLRAAEINNVRTHRVLAAEFKTFKSEGPQQTPGYLFGFGFIAPKIAGPGNLCFATGKRAASTIRSSWEWPHELYPLARPETADESAVSSHPLPQG